ncbi:MAG TPA: hypothetical protein VHB21_13445 [Minicystis sp.]|nr:hypothetical protein [Minicystis sp.]
MNISPFSLIGLILGASIYVGILFVIDRSLDGTGRAVFRWIAAALTIAGFFFGLSKALDNHDMATDVAKFVIAGVAAGFVFYEQRREGLGRPVAERWKRFIGLALAFTAIIAYFNGFKFGYPHYFHRWDQFHYYMGAKYFREMGYDGLYRCGVVAEDELGVQDREEGDDPDFPNKLPIDLSKEVRHADKKIRNLGRDNLLIPVTEVLAHPEECKSHFTPARWDAFKRDVRYFRLSSDKGYWEDMQKDHGYNPPPVWTILGNFFANLRPASMRYLQFLASLDILYLFGAFGMLWWAFGWRVFAVAAIFWGCQASAPFYWTGGAFLRQDWLFYLVASAALARKHYWKLSGAAMVYAGLLRVFPGLTVIGWLVVVGWEVYRKKRLAPHHKQMLIGGVLAAAVLIPTSIAVAGKDSYTSFYKHTLEVHDRTPLTNHMGLRVLISHNVGSDIHSGRMKYTKDTKLADPFEVWKRMRNERYDKYKWVGYIITLVSLLYFAWVCRRIKNMWVAQCLGQVFVILMSQLTCYYYSFMILIAPLTKLRRDIEAPLFGLALLTQVASGRFVYNDDKYTVLTGLSLVFSWGLLCAFSDPVGVAKVKARLFGPKKEEAAGT